MNEKIEYPYLSTYINPEGVKTIYAENYVNDKLVNLVDETMKEESKIEVSFDVTGRTKHKILAFELSEKLPQFDFDIDYNYGCTITLKY